VRLLDLGLARAVPLADMAAYRASSGGSRSLHEQFLPAGSAAAASQVSATRMCVSRHLHVGRSLALLLLFPFFCLSLFFSVFSFFFFLSFFSFFFFFSYFLSILA
jgi:hypothetical protein